MSGAVPTKEACAAIAHAGVGAHIVATAGCGTPTTLLRALSKHAAGRAWTLSSGLLLGEYSFVPQVRSGDLRYLTWHVMPPVRDLVAAGAAQYSPIRASHLAAILQRRGVDVALARISTPDRHGYVSVGPSASYALDALRLASVRIGEVDPQLPRTFGDTAVHKTVFDAMIDSADPTPVYTSAPPGEVSARIAEHVLAVMPQDPTLQIGIGAIPEAVVSALATADLGQVRFAGLVTDDMVDLFDLGVIPRSCGGPVFVSPELMGSAKLMQFADRNPAVGVYPSSVAHDPVRLGRSPRFVSLNTAIEVDLGGQVNSEAIGGRQVAGIGGSLDFADAAARSIDGMGIIALPSTTPRGISRIVASAATVTIPRSMIDVVVTEYGVARIGGRDVAERTEALIGIAHPDHRDRLREQSVALVGAADR